MVADHRAIAYEEQTLINGEPSTRVVYRASSLGRPLRCLVAARQQYDALDAPEFLAIAAMEGERLEPEILAGMREQGWAVSELQREVEYEVEPGDPTLIVRGHMDAGLATLGGVEFMCEVKTMSQRVFTEWQAHRWDKFPTYAAQVSFYMQATGRPALYVVHNRGTGEREYIQIKEQPVPWAKLRAKIMAAEWFVKEGTLPTCQGGTEYLCPYDYLCDRRTIYFAELESGDEELLWRTAVSYAETREAIAELEARKANLRGDIDTLLGEANAKLARGWKVTKYRSTSRRLNVGKLRERLGDELDGFFDQTTSTGIKVTGPSTGRSDV